MENVKTTQIIYKNIRQTKKWENFFNSIGWKSFTLTDGSFVYYFLIIKWGIAKSPKIGILNEDLLKELELKCKKNNIIFIKVEPSLTQNTQILEKNGYLKSSTPLTPSSTLLFDLSKSVEELWKEVSHSGKYGINRGIREGTKIDFIKNPTEDQIKDFYKNVLSYRSKEKNYIILSLDYTLKVHRAFAPDDYLSLIYDTNGNICGGKYYITNDKLVDYLAGGTTKLGVHNRSGFVQMWEAILYFKKLGFELMDLDGLYDERFTVFKKGWKGFSDFKLKFGGEKIVFPNPYVKIFNPLLQMIYLFANYKK